MGPEELNLLIPLAGVRLAATVSLPAGAAAGVIFAHGAESAPSLRVAGELQQAGIATVLVHLLTPAEVESERTTQHLRFDLELLSDRLAAVAQWLSELRPHIRLGYFGSGTGSAVALVAAARHGHVDAVVSRSGRPDLAGPELAHVRAATLLLAGGDDLVGLARNHDALKRLGGRGRLEVIPHARFLSDEPEALELAARLARGWFVQWLSGVERAPSEVHAMH